MTERNVPTDTDYLMEKRLQELDPELHRRFTDAVVALQHTLVKFKRLFPEYTDHSEFHSMDVINYCNLLIGEEQIDLMNAQEMYVLLMSCYLHDVGMCITQNDYDEFKEAVGEEEYFKQSPEKDISDFVRDNHNEFSALFIRKYAEMLEIPSEAYLFAVVQTCRGHRKTDLFDEEEYPAAFRVTDTSTVNLPYLAAVIRLADEIDVVSDRNPKLLYNIEDLTDEYQIAHNRLLEAVPQIHVYPDRFVLDVKTEDGTLWLALWERREKIQAILDYCREVVQERTPYRITQQSVELHRIE